MTPELKKAIEGLRTDIVERVKAVEEKAGATEGQIQDSVKNAVKDFDERIKGLEEAIKKSNVSLPGLEDRAKDFSFHKLFRAKYTGDWSEAGFEKEVMDSIDKIASTNTGASGGFLVPEEVSSQIIDLAIARMPVFQMGVTMLRGLQGDLAIPKITGRPSGYWVGENSRPTESNTTFEQRTLNPKRLAAYTKVSKRLILQSGGVAEQVVRDELSKGIRLTWHESFIEGTGTQHQPKGLEGYNITAVTAANGRFTFNHAAEMANKIDTNDRLYDGGSFGYLMYPTVKWGLKDERVAQYSGQASTAGQPIITPIMSDTTLEETLGYMVRTTTQIDNDESTGATSTGSTVWFGDWSGLICGMWQGMEMRVSDVAGQGNDSAFLQNELWLLTQLEVDHQLKDELMFTKCAGAETARSAW